MNRLSNCRGQALAELTIILPIAFLLLAAPGSLTHWMNDRFASDARRLDDELTQFQIAEVERTRALRSQGCTGSLAPSFVRPPRKAVSADWPTEVDQQRALSMAALRTACLAEATAKLGPAAALPLWTVHITAPHEELAKASAQTLCPLVKTTSERVRISITTAQRLTRPTQLARALRLLKENSDFCSLKAISASRLDRLFAPILDP